MKSEINLYCDESNHLIHNNKIMTLGYISCKKNKVYIVNREIRALKVKHNLNKNYEIKWTKVSKAKMNFYIDLLSLLKNKDFLRFRCIIADKDILDYKTHNITHDDWYYRIYYLLLGRFLNETKQYYIYIDIKDTCSKYKLRKLEEVLKNSYYDFSKMMIKKIQHLHSHESELLQLNDLLIGAIAYKNNNLFTSSAKLEVIKNIESTFNSDLTTTSFLSEKKFNLFKWGYNNDM